MNEIVRDQPIRYAQADANKVKAEKPAVSKEVKQNPEQKQFYDRWQKETAQAYQSEKIANQQARDRLKGLTAPELRRIGAKQALWGFGLSPLNAICGFLGVGSGFGIGMGLGSLASSAGSGALGIALGISAVSMPFVLGAAGVVAGAELARYIYEKVARKMDTNLPKVEKSDRIIGDIAPFVFSSVGNAPLVAGARNIFEGYNQMKSIQ